MSEAGRVPRWTWLLPPPLFGLVGLLPGKDDNWDLLHYHFYNPYALLNGRAAVDLAAADFHTYFNPLLDLPFYLAVHLAADGQVPAVLVAFVLGTLQGVNVSLLFALALAVLRPAAVLHGLTGSGRGPRWLDQAMRSRWTLPAAAALIGMCSGGSLYMLGTTFYDTLIGIPVLLALLLLAKGADGLFGKAPRYPAWRPAAAGLLCGAAAGLKLTAAVFGIGIGLALLLGPATWPKRWRSVLLYGLASATAWLALSGWWLWRIWQETGNPLFPYFNDLFQSPVAPVGNNRASGAMPEGLLETLFYPLLFTLEPRRIDSFVHDTKLLLFYLASPLGLVAGWLGLRRPPARGGGEWVEPRRALVLLLALYASYWVWLAAFSIHRYMVPLEMAVPLVLVATVGLLPLPQRWRAVLAVLLLVAALPIKPDWRHRVSWEGRLWQPFLLAEPPAEIDYGDALVLIPGWHPGWYPKAWVIPFFPPETAFSRIRAVKPAAEELLLLDGAVAERIEAHRGPLYALFTDSPLSLPPVVESLARVSLRPDFAACRAVAVNAGHPLKLCPVRRAVP